MRKYPDMLKKAKSSFNTRTFRKGAYSSGLTILAIIITLMANLIFAQLPANIKNVDISKSQIYSIGDVTKGILAGLKENITIYIVAEPAKVDQRIEKLVENYASSSQNISHDTLDPVLHPTVLSDYGAKENSLLIKCQATGRQKTVMFSDIIRYDQMSYYTSGRTTETEFDGEGQITGAINYVLSDSETVVCLTEGHNEGSLSAPVTNLLAKANISTTSVNLLMNGVPDNCQLLLINAPTKDLANDELGMITKYLDGGGKLLVLLSASDVKTPNIAKLISDYGLVLEDGYVLDTQRNYQNNYYYIFPLLNTSHEIGAGVPQGLEALVIKAKGLSINKNAAAGVTPEAFMATSSEGYAVTSETKKKGEFVLGATSSKKTADKESKIAVITAEYLINEDLTSAFSNLANLDIFMGTVNWFLDDVKNIAIEAKSLQVENNTVTRAGLYSLPFIIIPLAILVYGLAVYWKRRKL